MLETRCTAIKLSQNRAVEVLYRAGEELNIEVGKELIICAGAIQSPHLLMLSSRGDGDALSSCGIQPKHHRSRPQPADRSMVLRIWRKPV